MSRLDLPDPFIYAYKVRKVKMVVIDGRVQPQWASREAQVVNTVDIERVLREPDTYLLGWQEAHYKEEQTAVRDSILPRPAEVVIEKEHSLNVSIIKMMQEDYAEAASGIGVVKVPEYPSFESILFSQGWNFQWRPVGSEDILGYVADRKVVEAAYRHPVITRLLQKLGTVDSISLPPDNIPEPVVTESMDTNVTERLNKLELLVGELINELRSANGTNKVPYSPGGYEPGVVSDERNGADGVLQYADAGQPTITGPK